VGLYVSETSILFACLVAIATQKKGWQVFVTNLLVRLDICIVAALQHMPTLFSVLRFNQNGNDQLEMSCLECVVFGVCRYELMFMLVLHFPGMGESCGQVPAASLFKIALRMLGICVCFSGCAFVSFGSQNILETVETHCAHVSQTCKCVSSCGFSKLMVGRALTEAKDDDSATEKQALHSMKSPAAVMQSTMMKVHCTRSILNTISSILLDTI
jgi:hypothetical protein